MNGRLNNRDRLFIRFGKDGIAVADSAMWRKQVPRGQGRWKDITEAVLPSCSSTIPDQGSYVVITNASAVNITGISYSGFNWTGTLASGGMMVIELPADMTEKITFTTSAATGATFTPTKVQGTGTAPGAVAITALTTSITFPSTPGTQYKVNLA